MKLEVLTKSQIENRKYWVSRLSDFDNDFGEESEIIEKAIQEEIQELGIYSLLGHLRLCGSIPERYDHDSSEEKLYSKYTDIVIHEAYSFMGFTSLVIQERADVADVECVTDDYAFVADAKAFRLSRTAKNQKDFKVEAMDSWKHGKPYAMLVCPIYQLPSRYSQIYQQARARSVCILSYSHLSVISQLAVIQGQKAAIDLIHELFKKIEAMHPEKDAAAYWHPINRTIIDYNDIIRQHWTNEKIASVESIYIAKQEALEHLASERERIMRMSREAAISEVIKSSRLDKKIEKIESVSSNGLLEIN